MKSSKTPVINGTPLKPKKTCIVLGSFWLDLGWFGFVVVFVIVSILVIIVVISLSLELWVQVLFYVSHFLSLAAMLTPQV